MLFLIRLPWSVLATTEGKDPGIILNATGSYSRYLYTALNTLTCSLLFVILQPNLKVRIDNIPALV